MSHRHVARRFDRAAAAYDRVARIQQQVAADLLARLQSHPPPGRVLDVGCGTGTLTGLMAERWPQAKLEAFDISEQMVAACRERLGDRVETWTEDAATWDPALNYYDLVASTSALHWLDDAAPLLQVLRMTVRPGGHIALAVMLQGTWGPLREARQEVDPEHRAPRPLWSDSQWFEALQAAGWRISDQAVAAYEAKWPDARGFLADARAMGVTGGSLSVGQRPLSPARVGRLIKLLDAQRGEGPLRMPYRVGFFVAG